MITTEGSVRAGIVPLGILDLDLSQFGMMKMSADQKIADKYAAPNGARDLISRLYREIGISAVAAALAATARKPQKPLPSRKDIPAILRDDEAA